MLRLVLPILEINTVNYILDNYILWINMIILIIVVLIAISAYIEPFFEYKQWSYRINEEEIFLLKEYF
ncbi:hypothetical protein Q5M85_19670 [Paraclostridium bifermentans]|nr:hypothetical protein [Paraclostridium bifermentans]